MVTKMLFEEGIKQIGVKWTYTTASCIHTQSLVLLHLYVTTYVIHYPTLVQITAALHTHTHSPIELSSTL